MTQSLWKRICQFLRKLSMFLFSRPVLSDSFMDCRRTGLSVPHHLPKFAQVHVHCIGEIQQLYAWLFMQISWKLISPRMEVYGSFIHNCQNSKATEMSIVGEWISCGTFKRYYSELKRNELSNHEKTQRAYGNSLYFLLNIAARAHLAAQC